MFAHARVEGLEHLTDIDGPVVFASNHQSHMDVPGDPRGAARADGARAWRRPCSRSSSRRTSIPSDHTWRQWFTNSLNYYLACFYFNGFPIPQREAGTRHTLHYMGELVSEGWSILIFPEGVAGDDRRTSSRSAAASA